MGISFCDFLTMNKNEKERIGSVGSKFFPVREGCFEIDTVFIQLLRQGFPPQE